MGEKEQNTRYNWKFYKGKTHTKKKKFPRGKVPDQNAEESSSSAGITILLLYNLEKVDQLP